MREKITEKLLITLALAVLLSEILNVSNEVYGAMPFLNGIVMTLSIILIACAWWHLIISKDKKAKIKKAETTKRLVNLVEFDKIYKELCATHRKVLEEKRKKPKERMVFRYASLGVLGGTAVLGMFYSLCGAYEAAYDLILIIFLAVIAFLISIFSSEKSTIEYKAEYKSRIISSLVKHLSPTLRYSTTVDNEQVILFEYEMANFGLLEHNMYECLDSIEGSLNDEYIDMVELKLGNNIITESGKTRKIDIFKGYFAVLPLGVDTKFKLKISAVGIKTRAEIYEYMTNKLKLDSKEFEDNFVVQTNDRMLATRILTSEIMTELFDYRDKLGITLDIAIKNGNIYFLIYTGDIFEPDIMQDSMNKNVVLKDYATLKAIVDLMQKMSTVVREVQTN